MNSIKNLIFDFDGTLADTTEDVVHPKPEPDWIIDDFRELATIFRAN